MIWRIHLNLTTSLVTFSTPQKNHILDLDWHTYVRLSCEAVAHRDLYYVKGNRLVHVCYSAPSLWRDAYTVSCKNGYHKKISALPDPSPQTPSPLSQNTKINQKNNTFSPVTVEKWFRQRHLYLNFRVCCCSKQQGVYVAILRWQLVKHNNTPKAPRFHSAVGASNNLQKRGFASPAHLGNHFPANNIPADQILNRSEKEKKGRTVVSRQPESI